MFIVTSSDLQYKRIHHHLPLLATLGVTACMEDCILQLDMLKGHGSTVGFWVWRKNGAHEGGTVLTLCLDTLNNVISDSVGLWANQSFCYWTGSGDYSSWTFDFTRRQMVRACASFFFSPLRLDFVLGNLSWLHLSHTFSY